MDQDASGNPIPIQEIYANTIVTNCGPIPGQTDSVVAVLSTNATGFTVTMNNQARRRGGGGHLTVVGGSAVIIGGLLGGIGADKLTFDLGAAGNTFLPEDAIVNFSTVEVLSG